MKIADVLIKAYQYRYEKMKSKLNNVSDVFSNKYEEQKEFYQKLEKLDNLDAKLSHVEVKLYMMNKRIEEIDEKLQKKKALQKNPNRLETEPEPSND